MAQITAAQKQEIDIFSAYKTRYRSERKFVDLEKLARTYKQEMEAQNLTEEAARGYKHILTALRGQENWKALEVAAKDYLTYVQPIANADPENTLEKHGYSNLCKALYNQTKWPELEIALNDYKEFAEKHNHIDLKKSAWRELGNALSKQERWSELEKVARTSLTSKEAETSNIYADYGHSYLCQSLKSQEKWPELEAAARNYLTFAHALPPMKKNDQAKAPEEFLLKQPLYHSRSSAVGHLCNALTRQEKWTELEKTAHQIISDAKKTNDTDLLAYGYFDLAKSFGGRGKLEEARAICFQLKKVKSEKTPYLVDLLNEKFLFNGGHSGRVINEKNGAHQIVVLP